MLTVIGKAPSDGRAVKWICECDCGNIAYRTCSELKKYKTPSCGCYRKIAFRNYALARSKPDITGKRFGRLLVLGKGDMLPEGSNTRQQWRCLCDCGKEIQIPRYPLDYGRQVSCGCQLRENFKRKPIDLTGQRFGTLTALMIRPRKQPTRKPPWIFKCDCGNYRVWNISGIRNYQKQGIRINCGDRSQHPEKGLWYPPTPSPYPEEAGMLLKKYLHLAFVPHEKVQSEIEDIRRDRLLRICWILIYRRQQGEVISEEHERRYIWKSLRYASFQAWWNYKLEKQGGLTYNLFNEKKEIGGDMTDSMCLDYPEIILAGKLKLPNKRIKFRRY